MSYEVKYTEADKKRLKTWEWQGITEPILSMKLAKPGCSQCQTGMTTKPEWWKSCEHDPYWSSQAKTKKVQVWVDDPETGDQYLTEDTKTLRRVRVPNIIDVPLDGGINSGNGVTSQMARKGYAHLPDVGLAPMCQTFGCGKAWPTFGTAEGRFCSDYHAALVAATQRQVFLTVGVVQDPGSQQVKNAPSLADQLREINL